MTRRCRWLAVMAIGLASAVALRGTAAEDTANKPSIAVSADKAGDTVSVFSDKDRTRVIVLSHSGIGRATLRRTGEVWPKKLVLRLHLRGLESLSIANGKVTFGVSVLSHSGHRRLLSLKTGAGEKKVAAGSPYHTPIKACEADGKVTKGLPSAGGWFELVVPAELCKDNPAELKIAWVDFYR